MLQLIENKNLNGKIEFGICPLSVIPIRISPSHRSELVSQMLFGEMAEILESKGKNWLRIICEIDGFIGWVEKDQLLPISENTYLKYKSNGASCFIEEEALYRSISKPVFTKTFISVLPK